MRHALFDEMEKLQKRFELSKTVSPDYFEPGMMEYLDKSYGSYDEFTGIMTISFQVKGTRYEGRTKRIEKMSVGDVITLKRDPDNQFNCNNYILLNSRGEDVGNIPAELCNAMAPLQDAGNLEVIAAKVSYVEPLSVRNRHAKQGELFVEVKLKV